jgi:NAD(P)-dependent dehydrogenase (short-subunit alcohol dehydrogenase family)
VNNSGVTWGEALETYPDSAFSKLLTLNVQRVFTLTQKLLPMLRKAAKDGPARIINVSHLFPLLSLSFSEIRLLAMQIGSTNGVSVPTMETYAYSASKAALHQ